MTSFIEAVRTQVQHLEVSHSCDFINACRDDPRSAWSVETRARAEKKKKQIVSFQPLDHFPELEKFVLMTAPVEHHVANITMIAQSISVSLTDRRQSISVWWESGQGAPCYEKITWKIDQEENYDNM